jgi:hypothetical protein
MLSNDNINLSFTFVNFARKNKELYKKQNKTQNNNVFAIRNFVNICLKVV